MVCARPMASEPAGGMLAGGAGLAVGSEKKVRKAS